MLAPKASVLRFLVWPATALLGSLAIECGGQSPAAAAPSAAPAASPAAAPAPRPQPTALIDRSPEVPFERDYLGAPRPGQSAYEASAASLPPLSPFTLGYREAKHHLMAFFDGHPELEAVECMALHAREAEGARRVIAIATRHDNTQEYYVNFDEPRLGGGLVAVHRADVTCQVAEDWLHASLEFELRSEEHVSLRYVGAGQPDARWSLIPDPGQHNPTGGLVVMLPMETTLGTASSALSIGSRGYSLVPHEASHPPHFVAVHSYLARDFRFAYVGTYRRVEVPLEPHDSAQDAARLVSPVDGVEAEIVRTDGGVGEIRALVASDPAAAEAGHNVRLELNPPLPNLLAMQPGSRAELRFALSLGFREQPVAYGDVVVERRAKGIELRLLPRFPGWAARHRRLVCTVQIATDRVGTECQALLDHDPAPTP